MGRTVPSFRMVLEGEIARWKGFAEALPIGSDKEAFEELMNSCRCYASAAGAAVRPIVSEVMFMAILLAQQKEIGRNKAQLEKLEVGNSHKQ
ncbi:hypothetical protein KEJ18_07420 [Candidatus Bathyarchaeota archaeon]|nr:hypothetical protein [Candidatus Bathyarchaeota archaeon]